MREFVRLVIFEDKFIEYSATLLGEKHAERIGLPANHEWRQYTYHKFKDNYTLNKDDGILIQKYTCADASTGGYQFMSITDSRYTTPIYAADEAGSLSFDFYMSAVPFVENAPTHAEDSGEGKFPRSTR